MLTIYGIKNCDTMKKAFAWLDEHRIAYEFHDYKKCGISVAKLDAWEKALGWEALLNRRGTTWRKLPETSKSSIHRESALELMQEQTSLIRRPLLESGPLLLCGFDPEIWEREIRR